jgi:SNF2 family DNA or RNA helicase
MLIRTLERLGPEALPALVVCPNSMKYTWEEEITKWSNLSSTVIDGTAAKRKKSFQAKTDVYIINWESLRLHTRLAPYGSINLTDAEKTPKELNAFEWGTVIADEAHRAKDARSKQARALWHVSRGAKHRFAATGTPIESNPSELWPIMNFVSPEDFPRKTKYIERYCLQSFNPFGGMEIIGLAPEHAAEFHTIVDPRMIRRPKDVILPQLPPKVESIRYIPFTGKQKTAYDQMAKHMIAELDDEVLVTTSPIAQFMRLSQFASAFAEINDEGDVELTTPSNKIDALVELVEEAQSQQIVVFAESKQLINLANDKLVADGVTTGLITGDISTEMRQVVMNKFQAGEIQVVLGTAAAAEGITLTAASILVFMQRFWSSIKNKQASDRIHRIGQTAEKVDIITFATKGTVDEYREKVLDDKEESLQEILQDDAIRLDMLKWGKRRTKA